MDEIDKRLTILEDKSKNKNLPPGNDVQTTNNGSKTVDVVVRGFTEKKSAESIISEIEDMLKLYVVDLKESSSMCLATHRTVNS